MSTDYNAVCMDCKMWCHLGQRMGGYHSFGYGKNDAIGASLSSEFVHDHLGCDLRIMGTDSLPLDCIEIESDEKRLEWDKFDGIAVRNLCEDCGENSMLRQVICEKTSVTPEEAILICYPCMQSRRHQNVVVRLAQDH